MSKGRTGSGLSSQQSLQPLGHQELESDVPVCVLIHLILPTVQREGIITIPMVQVRHLGTEQ